MAVAGISLKRTSTGVARFATIDLRKHADFIPLLKERGVEMDEPIKWTKKMKRAMAETEYTRGDINNFWDE